MINLSEDLILRAVTLALTSFLLIGCAKKSDQVNLDRIDIYYRSFNALAPVSYSGVDLMRYAPTKMTLTRSRDINEFRKLVSARCQIDRDVSGGGLDVYVLIRMWSGGVVVKEWKASKFHFSPDARQSLACRLTRQEREAIAKWVERHN